MQISNTYLTDTISIRYLINLINLENDYVDRDEG